MIRVGKFLKYGVGAKMIRSGVHVCVVKEVKNIGHAVFNQEVALMWYFRDTPTIIELYGYNALTLTILLPFYELGSLQDLIKNDVYAATWSMEIVLQLATDVFFCNRHGARCKRGTL